MVDLLISRVTSVATHYLNILTIRLRGYSDRPLPEYFLEEQLLHVDIGGEIDVDQVASEIVADLHGGPRRVSQTVTEVSWGASGSGGELIVDIPAAISGVTNLAMLAGMAIRAVRRRHGSPRNLNGQQQAEFARGYLAGDLNIDASSIRIVGIEESAAGYRIVLGTPCGEFTAELGEFGLIRVHTT